MCIKINQARCDRCGEIIVSKGLHDFVTCKCGSLSVDGGPFYLRRCFLDDKWTELSIFEKEEPNEQSYEKDKPG